MKKTKLSVLLALSVAALSSVTMTSCGNSSVEGAGEALKVLTLDDLKAAGTAEKPIEVSFWHSFGDNIESQLTPLIEEFEEDMEEQGIYVKVSATSTGGGYDGLRSRVNSGVRSNSIPTMLLGYPDHFADYINSKILLPLDSYVNSTDADVGMSGDYDYADIYSNYKTETLLDADGDGKKDICAIPFNKSTEVMYYNASIVDPILEANGIEKDANGNWKNPTWEQVWTVCRAVKDKVAKKTATWTYDRASYSMAKCDYPAYIDSEANFFITTARQWASSKEASEHVYTTSNSVSSGTVVFDNPTTRAAQEYFLEKATEGLWNVPAKVSQGYGSNLMKLNEAVLSIGSTAGVNNNDSQKYELKVTSIPQKSYDANAVQAVIQQGTNAAILSPNSNNITRLTAWLLIRHLTSTESTAKFSKKTGYLPVRESAKNSTSYQSFLNLAKPDADKNTMDYIKYANAAKAVISADAQISSYYTDPAFKGSSVVRANLETLVDDIYVTGNTVDHAYSAIYAKLKKLGIACESYTSANWSY